MQRAHIINTLIPLFLMGCGNHMVPDQLEDPLLAKVYDVELRYSEALAAVAGLYTSSDSAEVFYEYTQSWIREQTLLHKAKELLTDFEKDKSDLIIKYYNNLLIYELHEKLLQQNLDTTVAEVEIAQYYQEHIQNFELKENIVRLQFVKFANPVPNPDKLWDMFVKGDPNDLDGMRQLAELSGGNHFEDDSLWLTFNDILKEIPIVTYNQENYLNNNKYIRLVDQGYTYFVRILDFKVKNNVSPLEFEKPRIVNIIVNKRKVEKLQQIEDDIVREAYKNQKIELF